MIPVKLVFAKNSELSIKPDSYVLIKGTVEKVYNNVGVSVILYGDKTVYGGDISSVVEPYLISDDKFKLFESVYYEGIVEPFTSHFMDPTIDEMKNVKKVVVGPNTILSIYKEGGFEPISIYDIQRILYENSGNCFIKEIPAPPSLYCSIYPSTAAK